MHAPTHGPIPSLRECASLASKPEPARSLYAAALREHVRRLARALGLAFVHSQARAAGVFLVELHAFDVDPQSLPSAKAESLAARLSRWDADVILGMLEGRAAREGGAL